MTQSTIVGDDGPASCGNEPAARGLYQGSGQLIDSFGNVRSNPVKNFLQELENIDNHVPSILF